MSFLHDNKECENNWIGITRRKCVDRYDASSQDYRRQILCTHVGIGARSDFFMISAKVFFSFTR